MSRRIGQGATQEEIGMHLCPAAMHQRVRRAVAFDGVADDAGGLCLVRHVALEELYLGLRCTPLDRVDGGPPWPLPATVEQDGAGASLTHHRGCLEPDTGRRGGE